MKLKAVPAEFKHPAVLGNAEERRPYTAGCLLPGSLCQHSKSDVLIWFGQAGIGTYTSSVLKTPILESISKTLDLMFASDIGNHIQGLSVSPQVPLFLPSLTNRSRGIYVFDAKLLVNRTLTPDLKEAYHSQLDRLGDNICIFGFSRGAMTARALAGMVQKVGLLPLFNLEQLPFAYAMYTREDFDGLMLSMQFKRTFSIDVRIMFLGVWYVVRPSDRFPISYLHAGTQCTLLD